MKKKEIKLIVASLVECGRGLAFADHLPEGAAKKEGTRLLNEQIEGFSKQLELLAEDASFREVKEAFKA